MKKKINLLSMLLYKFNLFKTQFKDNMIKSKKFKTHCFYFITNEKTKIREQFIYRLQINNNFFFF